MIQLVKFVLIGGACLVGLLVLALSCVVLMFFPEWVRWVAFGATAVLIGWYFLFGRFRRKSGLLINDGAVYDRWRSASKVRKDFL